MFKSSVLAISLWVMAGLSRLKRERIFRPFSKDFEK
jgi:hypothetical protein